MLSETNTIEVFARKPGIFKKVWLSKQVHKKNTKFKLENT